TGLPDKADELARAFAQDSAAVKAQPTTEAVEDLRLKYLGRKGHIAGLMESLKTCSKEERPVAGKAINVLKQTVEKTIEELKTAAARHAITAKLAAPPLDVSLPVQPASG